MNSKLYYVHDPMCAWCWGYQPTWQKIEQALTNATQQSIEIVYLVGGLAADSEQPMPIEMQQQIASYWHKIERYLGTQFNHDFWQENVPRRSTYPACRAVLAARQLGQEKAMITAIQQGYYLRALNPSDESVLVQLAQELGLDMIQFRQLFASSALNQQLLSEINFARSIGGNSFPSLFFERQGEVTEIAIDYQNASHTVQQLALLSR
ncbi:hypothetical protein VII00023_05577 [Vibrio ichthyoenteri ATCC 700023]|uniref:DSBA-like thioredoxin domain-containing protein n=1 Tax=Vibrio ichthyoenteri ATCC 700023 TaxID=870968 RepID=F9S6B1_9VIBR|nr:hypothetical protein VII00023_05577 [Vibrio ichthyoenteri ATCC 700023]